MSFDILQWQRSGAKALINESFNGAAEAVPFHAAPKAVISDDRESPFLFFYKG